MTTGLTVLISADMEGISGIVHATQTNPGGYDYERSRRLMTGEVNAAVAGVLDAEPDAVVLVADAHGLYRNLLVEELHSVRPYGPYTVDLATLVPGSARPPPARVR